MGQLRRRKNHTEVVDNVTRSASELKQDGGASCCHYTRWWILLLVFGIRLFNAFSTKTFFQADEYYQLLEIAHSRVFGYGYVTWEWKEKLRSSLHPMIYVLGYTLASVTPTPNAEWMIFNGPKIINAVIATTGDWATYRFALVYMENETYGIQTLWMSLLSGFNWYVITRSFSNTLEMVLTAVALSLWSWNGAFDVSHLVGCAFGMVTCILRPTNGLLWIYLGGLFLVKQRGKSLVSTIRIVLLLVAELLVILLLSCVADYWFYGEFTVPLVNFVEFNVVRNLSIFYGSAPWHFYLFQAVPILTLGFLPLLVVSFYNNVSDPLTHIAAFVVFGYLCVAHKEFRFIYALQPIFLVLVCKAYHQVSTRYRKFLLVIAVVGNAIPGYFFSQINERGVIDIMQYLRTEVPENNIVGFLTPCHSTPWQSHLHLERMENQTWFLTCEPPLHLQHGTLELVRSYRDISDQFYDDPVGFISTRIRDRKSTQSMPDKHHRDTLIWPDRLIAFEPLESLIQTYLGDNEGRGNVGIPRYFECRRFFNSYFHWDPRRRGDLVVYCRRRE